MGIFIGVNVDFAWIFLFKSWYFSIRAILHRTKAFMNVICIKSWFYFIKIGILCHSGPRTPRWYPNDPQGGTLGCWRNELTRLHTWLRCYLVKEIANTAIEVNYIGCNVLHVIMSIVLIWVIDDPRGLCGPCFAPPTKLWVKIVARYSPCLTASNWSTAFPINII